MSYVLVFLAWWLAAGPVLAPAARPDLLSSATVAPAAPDTVAALHRLFAAKRQKGVAVIGFAVGAGVVSGIVGEATQHTCTSEATPLLAIALCFSSTPITAAEALQYSKYSRVKEKRAIGAFEKH